MSYLCAGLPIALEGPGGWLILNELHQFHLDLLSVISKASCVRTRHGKLALAGCNDPPEM
jgi:hypothetical protein